jgi:hypothetical protein
MRGGSHVAILKVAKLGSPILRKRALEIEAHDLRKGRFRAFFEDMMETMKNAARTSWRSRPRFS